MAEVSTATAVPLRLHRVLLTLAGRVDDSALTHARELAATARTDEAVDLIAATLAAGRIAVSAAEQRELADLLVHSGSDPSLAEYLVVDEQVLRQRVAHRFTSEEHPSAGVSACARWAIDTLPDVRSLHAVWRSTTAGRALGPVPQRVLLVRVGSEDATIATSYRLASALARAGIDAAVEVSGPGSPWTHYHEDALAAAVQVAVDEHANHGESWMSVPRPPEPDAVPEPPDWESENVPEPPEPDAVPEPPVPERPPEPEGVPETWQEPEPADEGWRTDYLGTTPEPEQPATASFQWQPWADTESAPDGTQPAPGETDQQPAVPSGVPGADEPSAVEPDSQPGAMFWPSEEDVAVSDEEERTEFVLLERPAEFIHGEQPAEITAELTDAELDLLRSALAEGAELDADSADMATVRQIVELPGAEGSVAKVSDRDRELLRQLHAELARREQEASASNLNGVEHDNGSWPYR